MISQRLYGLLLVTVLATIGSQIYPAMNTADAMPANSSETATRISNAAEPQPHGRANITASNRDLFASQLPPPPPPAPVIIAPPPPPEPPKAPPVPFQYLGMLEEGEQLHIYLSKGEMTYITHVGEKLDEVYLVKRLDKQGIRVVYLPLSEEQTIPLLQ